MKIYWSSYWNDYIFETMDHNGWPIYAAYSEEYDSYIPISPINLEFICDVSDA